MCVLYHVKDHIVQFFYYVTDLNSRYSLMLSTWDRKDVLRPTFSDLVSTLSSYLEYTSDYLDLNPSDKISKPDPKTNGIEEDPKHIINRIPSTQNDYFNAGSDS